MIDNSNRFAKESKQIIKDFYVTEDNLLELSTQSKGNQMKFHLNNDWIKSDYLGYESISEVIVSILLSCIKDLNYVSYNFCSISFRDLNLFGCYSKSFIEDCEEFITFDKLLSPRLITIFNERNSRKSPSEKLTLLLDEVYSITKLNVFNYLQNNIFIDAITLNEDRHLSNLGVIRCADSSYKETPIFDNGASLLSDLTDYRMDTSLLINERRVKSKPFSTDFKKQVKLFSSSGYKFKIDYSKLNDKLNSLPTLGVDSVNLNRALTILTSQLKLWEGILWERI